MSIFNCTELAKSFASRPLFDGISFAIEAGERIGLIGPNGAGKSTLLKIIAGMETPDDGDVAYQRGLKVSMLPQVPEFKKGVTVEGAILDAISGAHDFECISTVHEYMSRLSLDGSYGVNGESLVEILSGGWKKRVALARALASNPDILLLDEPTNHLDVESILWLETFLARAQFATVTVTHDRLFLQRVANRIWELDKRNAGGLLKVSGDYADYLEAKADLMAAQEKKETTLKNTLRRETEWLRRGPKARSTKQYARIKQAGELKQEVSELEYRNRVSTVQLDFRAIENAPKKLIEALGISKSFGGHTLFKNFDLLVKPGLRLGLMGANGCGKTTLIRVLLGEEKPDSGDVERSEQLEVVYFEQNRETLDPTSTVIETLCSKGDHVKYQGNFIHIRSYLDRFHFGQHQMNMEVRRLSGGEQSRLLIARLMLKEANVLVLDEPTNDLDMATLDVLEQCLLEFPGAIILVTHDRYFLDQVANSLLAFGEKGTASEGSIMPFASLEQWERAFYEARSAGVKETVDVPKAGTAKTKKLTFKEQFELDHIEEVIQKVENKLAQIKEEICLPENISNASRLAELALEMSSCETEIARLYVRWAELEK